MANVMAVWFVISTASLLALAAGPASGADDKMVVRSGESAVVARSTQPITGEKANLGSVTKVVQGTGPAATNVLLYVSPADRKEAEDAVQYTLNGQVVTTHIAVKPSIAFNDSEFYGTSFKALFALFILAVLIESGLALIFRWRPFLDYFDSRTVNAIVAFVLSLMFVRLFDLDIATKLVNTYSGTAHPSNWPGLVLTALIIAGGSAGVNRILQTLGFRAAASEQPPPPKPPEREAWIAVTLVRQSAVGPVSVFIGPAGNPAVAGTISGVSAGRSLWRYLVRDKGRFPQSGGFTVGPGSYEVFLRGIDRSGATVESRKWGPYDIAPRAIVDIELSA